MKAVIIDDEPKAIKLIENYLQHFRSVELAGTFRNGLKAFEYLSKENIDLIFLDINMPHLSGISLSKIIDPKTKIIFTTAYSEYAAESYEVEAIDYLLKPISLERFTKAMGKILPESDTKRASTDGSIIPVKSGSKLYRLKPKNIFYLEKDGNYMTYYIRDSKILARESINESLEKLPHNFMQTHRSFIVNIQKVSYIEGDKLMIQNHTIPISNTHKEKLMRRLKI